MSRIQKALVKAREKRETDTKASKGGLSPLDHIKYSKTQVVPISPAELQKNQILAAIPHSEEGQIFRTLRTKIARKMRQNNWVTIGVTSANKGEGKTLVASNLAVALAMELNQSVMLVDMDMQNPKIHSNFNLEPSAGLAELLKGEAELEDILLNPGIERLVILPGHGSSSNSSELLAAPVAEKFFKDAKKRYRTRLIVCDLPAVLPTDDVLASIHNIDCSLLVLEEGRNSEVDIRRVMQVLQNTEIVGTVLNKTHSTISHNDSKAG